MQRVLASELPAEMAAKMVAVRKLGVEFIFKDTYGDGSPVNITARGVVAGDVGPVPRAAWPLLRDMEFFAGGKDGRWYWSRDGRKGEPNPVVGMGATEYWWSDRKAYTIVRVQPNLVRFWMKEDTATRTDKNGMSDSQDYRYEPDPDAPEIEVTLRPNGRYCRKGPNGNLVGIGYRNAHHDYSH